MMLKIGYAPCPWPGSPGYGLVHDGEGAAGRKRHRAGHLMPLVHPDLHISMPRQQALQVALCKVSRLTCKRSTVMIESWSLRGMKLCAGISHGPTEKHEAWHSCMLRQRILSFFLAQPLGFLGVKGYLSCNARPADNTQVTEAVLWAMLGLWHDLASI